MVEDQLYLGRRDRNHQTETRNARNICTAHPARAPAANLLANHLFATFSLALLVLKFSSASSFQITFTILWREISLNLCVKSTELIKIILKNTSHEDDHHLSHKMNQAFYINEKLCLKKQIYKK